MQGREILQGLHNPETIRRSANRAINVIVALSIISALANAGYALLVTQQAERQAAKTYPPTMSSQAIDTRREEVTQIANELLQLADPKNPDTNKPDVDKYETAISSLAAEKNRKFEERKLSTKLANGKGRPKAITASIASGILTLIAWGISSSIKKPEDSSSQLVSR